MDWGKFYMHVASLDSLMRCKKERMRLHSTQSTFKLLKKKEILQKTITSKKVVLHSDGGSFLNSWTLQRESLTWTHCQTHRSCLELDVVLSLCTVKIKMPWAPSCVSDLYPDPSCIPEVPATWHQSLTAQHLYLWSSLEMETRWRNVC